MRDNTLQSFILFFSFVILSGCGNNQRSNAEKNNYFNRKGDNDFVDSIIKTYENKPNELFEINAEYVINSSFDNFYQLYLKEIGKLGGLIDEKPRLYVSKFIYKTNDTIKSEIQKSKNKYPSSFLKTIENDLPIYLFITSYDVKYQGGNRFEDGGFSKNQIGSSYSMGNYGTGKGKIYSINFMYVDVSNSDDKDFKLASYNTGNKYFGFVEIGKISSQYSGHLSERNSGEFNSQSFHYMNYDYSFHKNGCISKEFDENHFSKTDNPLVINLFSKNNNYKTIDELIKNSEYVFYGEHIESRKRS